MMGRSLGFSSRGRKITVECTVTVTERKVIRRRLVVQPLQQDGGGDERSGFGG